MTPFFSAILVKASTNSRFLGKFSACPNQNMSIILSEVEVERLLLKRTEKRSRWCRRSSAGMSAGERSCPVKNPLPSGLQTRILSHPNVAVKTKKLTCRQLKQYQVPYTLREHRFAQCQVPKGSIQLPLLQWESQRGLYE